MYIAICDDEKIIRETLADFIKHQKADCHIESYSTGDELLAAGNHFDMIFLDIQMKGKNGMETAKAIRESDKEAVIIFVTAIKAYVFQAFDVGAFHYLLKPVEEKKFIEVFENAVREIKRQKSKQESELPILRIKARSHSYILKQSEIIFIENRANKVEIHTTRDIIEAYYTMSKLEGELGNSFYRCHRGYLVNMAHIAEYSSDKIDMDNGEQVYLAKERYPAFIKTYMRYLDDGGAAGA